MTKFGSRAVWALLLATVCDPGVALAEAGQNPSVAGEDPYIWLEQADDPAARKWAAEQTARALDRLKAVPGFAAIESEIHAVQERSSPPPSIFPLGDKLLRFERDRENPLGVFSVAPLGRGRPGKWRTVLDVAAYNREHGTNFKITFLSPEEQCLAPRFERCLIPFAEGGSSLLQYHEFDLATGRFVPDGFVTPPIRAGVAWLDKDTLVVGHSLGSVPALKSGFAGAIYEWKRGTPLAQSREIFRANAGDSLIGTTPLPHGKAGPLIVSLARDYRTFEVNLMDGTGGIERLPLPTGLQKFGAPIVAGRHLMFQLTKAAEVDGTAFPADSLIAYEPLAAPGERASLVVAPEEGVYINDAYGGLAPMGDAFAYVETRNLRKSVVLARRGADGAWSHKRLLQADPGVAVTILGTGFEQGVVVRQSGFLKPGEIGFLTPNGKLSALYAATPVIDASRFVSEVRSARSPDGTLVDYYLVRPKAAAAGPVPTIITGYGGYGVNLDPDYFSGGLGPALVPWLERGGAFALAAIRGGGERGSAWADAARGTHRQRSYDDFAAVAEDLVHSGFTALRRIGVFGRSFGGLLAANMGVQRPDLFGAAVVGVPIVDLFRLGRSGNDISAGQKVEVGDWDDPAQAAIMWHYSPYQNIRGGVDYPRFLTVVSTKDGQVGPGHGRKFTARLNEVGADAMLIEGPSGGHGFPDQFADPEAFAAQMAFFVDALMPSQAEASPRR